MYASVSARGDTIEEALAEACYDLASGCEDWPDPFDKPGYVQVWGTPVSDCAIEWMRGWVQQNPPAAVWQEAKGRSQRKVAAGWRSTPERELGDKFGPWWMFPLASGGWHFFGWVNT
jgi:hypothetical protein